MLKLYLSDIEVITANQEGHGLGLDTKRNCIWNVQNKNTDPLPEKQWQMQNLLKVFAKMVRRIHVQ